MRNRHEAALQSWKTRRNMAAWKKSHASEKASKKALQEYCTQRGWKVAFFEGTTGAPRTGIIDAIAYRLGKRNPDEMELRLIQLKGGNAGITAVEIGRLKKAAAALRVKYLIAEFDGDSKALHLLPDGLDV